MCRLSWYLGFSSSRNNQGLARPVMGELCFTFTCPTVCIEYLRCHWRDFHEIGYLYIFWKSVDKIQVSLKSDNNNGYFTWRPIYIFLYLARFFLKWEMFQTKFADKIKTRILRSVTPPTNRAVNDIMWKNTVDPGSPLMSTASSIPKAKHTHSEYVTLIAFLHEQFQQRDSLLRCMYISCLVRKQFYRQQTHFLL
jgi:hypothetical protein